MSSRISKTAPELAPSLVGSSEICCSNPERVGRDGYLSLEFEPRLGRTALTRCRFRFPLQVLKPSYIDNDGSAFVLLLNPAGGVAGGDCLETEILLRKGSRVCLSTPSAAPVYRALSHPAIQRTNIRLEEESVLEYFPEYLIPYAGSALWQSVRVQMAPRSFLILSEALAAGRIARHERWKFKELVSETEIRLGNSPIYISKSKIVPLDLFPTGLGVTDDFNYIASVLVVSDGFCDWKRLVNELSAVLRTGTEVQGGVSLGGHASCLVQIMALTATELTGITQSLWTCVREIVLNEPPHLRRKY